MNEWHVVSSLIKCGEGDFNKISIYFCSFAKRCRLLHVFQGRFAPKWVEIGLVVQEKITVEIRQFVLYYIDLHSSIQQAWTPIPKEKCVPRYAESGIWKIYFKRKQRRWIIGNVRSSVELSAKASYKQCI